MVTQVQESPLELKRTAPEGTLSSTQIVVSTVFEGVIPVPPLITTTLVSVMLPELRTRPE